LLVIKVFWELFGRLVDGVALEDVGVWGGEVVRVLEVPAETTVAFHHGLKPYMPLLTDFIEDVAVMDYGRWGRTASP
jgi:hypothetical protein